MTHTPRHTVFLTGFMGVGKSAVGRQLASQLGWRFVDTDQRVEELAGQTIAHVFERSGEPTFRAWESRVIAEVAGVPNIVVALGGGALADPINRDLVLRSGKLVYLRAAIEALIGRIDTAKRPLVRGLQGDALRERVADLLQKRAPTYELAHLRVDTDGKTVEEVAREIRDEVAAWKK
jgi:shikimate kinase